MDLLNEYLASLSSAQTVRAYEKDLHQFFADTEVTSSRLQAVDSDEIRTFVRSMHDRGLSVSMQQRRLAALRGFFDWLIDRGVVSHNPARHPQVHPEEPDSEETNETLLETSDVEALLEAAGEAPDSGLRDQTLILTIVYAALRRSEVASLDVEHLRPLGRYWVFDLSGSSRESGYVRVPEPLVERIEHMQDVYGITSGALWRSLSSNNYGNRMSPDAIYKVVRRVSERAGLESVSIETLRRTGLQLALDGGADVTQVKAHGRFSDAASAARVYDPEARPKTLGDSAVEYIDLDIPSELNDT